MNLTGLTESQLFTIEALNRIDGFVWPDGTSYASVDGAGAIHFFTSNPANGYGRYISSVHGLKSTKECKLASVTREQFDSVDGWVRSLAASVPNDIPKCGIEIEFGKFGRKWRYHKPTKENEMQQDHPAALITDLLERYTKKRNERERLQTEIECFQTEKDRVKGDEDKLIEQIRQWHLQYGFDIRVLDESDEKPEHETNPEPELVITDWRDLQAGDVIECIKPNGGSVKSGDIGTITIIDKMVLFADFDSQNGYAFASESFNSLFKFIRRPSK